MQDLKVTLAALKSVVIDKQRNLERVEHACSVAAEQGARMVVMPELMLSGHAGHPMMVENAEEVPDGPQAQAVVELSRRHDLCVCVGIAERCGSLVFNSQFVVDRGRYLGLQRKINLSKDEYLWFGWGEEIPVFDIGEARFGIVICYDNLFSEHALALGMQDVDLILAPHAARVGVWPEPLTTKFCRKVVENQQNGWKELHRVRARDANAFVLLCNAVGSSTEGLSDLENYPPQGPGGIDVREVIANHAGTVMALDPKGSVILSTSTTRLEEDILTVELRAEGRQVNHAPSRNRRPGTILSLLEDAAVEAR